MRNGALGPSMSAQGSGLGLGKVGGCVGGMREGAGTGSRMWVVRERVLFGECMDVLELGE